MTARRVAEHISVLWKGKIVESGPAEELSVGWVAWHLPCVPRPDDRAVLP